MLEIEEEKSARVLDPVERVSEVIFGLLMAMTFVGALSVATAGREDVRTMMITALGCNLAWGLADAVMYLVRTATARTRSRNLFARLRSGTDAATGRALVAEALPGDLAAVADAEVLELLRRRLVEASALPMRPRLGLDDFKGALGVFLLVALATFPVVVPFMLLDEAALAVRVSNVIALAMLFLGGGMLARYSGGSVWRSGAAMAVTGALLMAAIMALGG
jgi:VIT1/CCC1 family predicted Fe2+/Mn2+ transporter